MRNWRRFAAAAAVLTSCLATPAFTAAQDFPAARSPIKIVVGFPPGGSSDFVARTIANKLSENMGHTVIVDNKPGGTTIVAGSFVAQAKPDGYTLLQVGELTQAALPSLHKQLPFDAVGSFAPITNVVESPLVLSVHPSVPVKTVQELIAYAKANPGKLNYGSAGIGNTLHLATAAFEEAAGITMQEVPFKGASESILSLVAGRIDVMFDLPQTPLPFIKDGKLRALAVTGKERLDLLPDVPTMAEAGVPGFVFVTRIGFVAPANTPDPIVSVLHKEIVKAAQDPAIQKQFREKAMFVQTSASPADYRASLNKIVTRVAEILKKAGVEAK